MMSQRAETQRKGRVRSELAVSIRYGWVSHARPTWVGTHRFQARLLLPFWRKRRPLNFSCHPPTLQSVFSSASNGLSPAPFERAGPRPRTVPRRTLSAAPWGTLGTGAAHAAVGHIYSHDIRASENTENRVGSGHACGVKPVRFGITCKAGSGGHHASGRLRRHFGASPPPTLRATRPPYSLYFRLLQMG